MKTDRVYLNNNGVGREKALEQIECFCNYNDFIGKDRIYLRLLTEELVGMVLEIGGEFDAEFWIENDNKACRLCLEAEMNLMNSKKRDTFINISTSGKNASINGIMSRIRDVVERYMVKDRENIDTYFSNSQNKDWTLNGYKTYVSKNKSSRQDEWDEHEKSIIANLADDVTVGVRDHSVMVIIKKTLS